MTTEELEAVQAMLRRHVLFPYKAANGNVVCQCGQSLTDTTAHRRHVAYTICGTLDALTEDEPTLEARRIW